MDRELIEKIRNRLRTGYVRKAEFMQLIAPLTKDELNALLMKGHGAPYVTWIIQAKKTK